MNITIKTHAVLPPPHKHTCAPAKNGTNRKRQLTFVYANEKRKRQTSVCLLQTETEVSFPWSANDIEIDDCYFSKRALLCAQLSVNGITMTPFQCVNTCNKKTDKVYTLQFRF
jgi:hypothetical protein